VAVQAQFLDYVLEQLASLGALRWRRMFGGVGLYSGDLFFGLIDDDTLFFKTDESNAAPYQSRNMPRFMPPADRPLGAMGYHQVPVDVIEDAQMLIEWARRSVAVALSSHAAKRRTVSPRQPTKRSAEKPASKATAKVRAAANGRRTPARKSR
jgi:DNA transformation protein